MVCSSTKAAFHSYDLLLAVIRLPCYSIKTPLTKKAMSFQAYWTESHDDFLLLGRRLYQLSITNSAKHSSQTYSRAAQRCFWLLALISRSQVRYIHLPKQMILPGTLIPSDKYILKNLTSVVHSHLCVYVTTLVKFFTWLG